MAKPRSYAIDPHNGKVVCYRNDDSRCVVASFVGPKEESAFHDDALTRCTNEINALLGNIREKNRDKSRELEFLITPKGLLLAWTNHAIGPDDDEAEINRALGI